MSSISWMPNIHWHITGKTPTVPPSHLTKVLLQGNTMTAITSGTYGHQPIFTGAIRQLVAGLFSSSRPARKPAAATVRPALVANAYRVRIREANDVRALA